MKGVFGPAEGRLQPQQETSRGAELSRAGVTSLPKNCWGDITSHTAAAAAGEHTQQQGQVSWALRAADTNNCEQLRPPGQI